MSSQQVMIWDVLNEMLAREGVGEDVVPMSTVTRQTDAIIAHLWSRADDWGTVQRPVAGMLEGEVKCDVHPESYHGKLEDMAAQITTTIMTALLGPKPSGEEANNEV